MNDKEFTAKITAEIKLTAPADTPMDELIKLFIDELVLNPEKYCTVSPKYSNARMLQSIRDCHAKLIGAPNPQAESRVVVAAPMAMVIEPDDLPPPAVPTPPSVKVAPVKDPHIKVNTREIAIGQPVTFRQCVKINKVNETPPIYQEDAFSNLDKL